MSTLQAFPRGERGAQNSGIRAQFRGFDPYGGELGRESMTARGLPHRGDVGTPEVFDDAPPRMKISGASMSKRFATAIPTQRAECSTARRASRSPFL